MRIGLASVLLLLGACGTTSNPPLIATDVVVTKPATGMAMSAAYMSLSNTTQQAIRISRVTSPQYASVQLHETTVEDGIARMRALAVLEIPGGETVLLRRGGKHLMLMRPTGQSDTVTLHFHDDDALILSVEASVDVAGN